MKFYVLKDPETQMYYGGETPDRQSYYSAGSIVEAAIIPEISIIPTIKIMFEKGTKPPSTEVLTQGIKEFLGSIVKNVDEIS